MKAKFELVNLALVIFGKMSIWYTPIRYIKQKQHSRRPVNKQRVKVHCFKFFFNFTLWHTKTHGALCTNQWQASIHIHLFWWL